MELLTINDAAVLSGKSIQTIRRMIKQKKVQVKKQKTPQGFNYLIIKQTLLDYIEKSSRIDEDMAGNPAVDREHRSIHEESDGLFKKDLERLTTTIQKLVDQQSKDKENFFGLIKTFQDRVFTLEEQIKMLDAPRQLSAWWQFWK